MPETDGIVDGKRTKKGPPHRRWAVIIALLVLVAGLLAGGIWKLQQRSSSIIDIAFVENMALPLPEKPSIAVLPFKNIGDDSAQEYFADGMTDDLITDLSKISGLFVIARNSVFTYKDKPISIELGGLYGRSS